MYFQINSQCCNQYKCHSKTTFNPAFDLHALYDTNVTLNMAINFTYFLYNLVYLNRLSSNKVIPFEIFIYMRAKVFSRI